MKRAGSPSLRLFEAPPPRSEPAEPAEPAASDETHTKKGTPRKKSRNGEKKMQTAAMLVRNPPTEAKIEHNAKRRREGKSSSMRVQSTSGGTQTMLFANQARSRTVNIVDLFCCIGGFSTGATQAGHKVVLAVDGDEIALAAHEANHPQTKHACMWLSEDTEEELVALMMEALPKNAQGQFEPWHLHGSPPCQKFSAMQCCKGKASTEEDRDARIKEGMEMVVWYMAFVERCRRDFNLVGWSFEEVANGELLGELADMRSPGSNQKQCAFATSLKYGNRSRASWFDYEVFQFAEFGVPQTRTRVIGGSPFLINRMRHTASLRVSKPVSIAEAVPDIPENAQYMRTSWSRAWNPALSTTTEAGEFFNADAETLCRLLSEPSFTLTARPAYWWTDRYEDIGEISLKQCRAIQTFPLDYKLPPTVLEAACGVGNAVPPLFAKKLMADYRPPGM